MSDYQCDDPLYDPNSENNIYCPKGYYPRNWRLDRPDDRQDYMPIPEVLQLKNGTVLKLTEEWEWFWFDLFRSKNPGVSDDELKILWKRHLRGNAGFTNKAGIDTCRSYVLGTNMDADYMRKAEIVTPGGNRFKRAGDPFSVDGKLYQPIYNIDATLPPPKLPIPEWLYFTAKIVHPKRIGAPRPDAPNGVFLVTEWDGHFPVPLTTLIGKQVMIDGIACRINAMRAVRLR